MTHRHSLQPLFFGLAKQKKKLISTARNNQKKTPWNCPQKELKEKIEVCRNLMFDALCIKDVIHTCQRLHARFPVGRVVYGITFATFWSNHSQFDPRFWAGFLVPKKTLSAQTKLQDFGTH